MNENSVNKDKSSSAISRHVDERAGKYLTFRLAAEEYGLEILKVREIIGLMGITRVPKTPDYIRGVINLRGKVIPVLELRAKFGMDAKQDNEETCIIVVDIAMNDDTVLMGLLVDAVSEVLDIKENEIQDPPSFGGGVDTNFILGIGNVKGGVKILLDIDKVIVSSGLQDIEGLMNSVEMDEPAAEITAQ